MIEPQSDSLEEKRVKDRVALDRPVQLRFPKFQDFLIEMSANVSPGGMFIRSDRPQPVGEQFDFECSLEDDFPLVSGRGEVVWIRQRSEGPDRPRGMGIRYLELKGNSEALVKKIVGERLESGQETFDLEGSKPSESAQRTFDDDIMAVSSMLVEKSGPTEGATEDSSRKRIKAKKVPQFVRPERDATASSPTSTMPSTESMVPDELKPSEPKLSEPPPEPPLEPIVPESEPAETKSVDPKASDAKSTPQTAAASNLSLGSLVPDELRELPKPTLEALDPPVPAGNKRVDLDPPLPPPAAKAAKVPPTAKAAKEPPAAEAAKVRDTPKETKPSRTKLAGKSGAGAEKKTAKSSAEPPKQRRTEPAPVVSTTIKAAPPKVDEKAQPPTAEPKAEPPKAERAERPERPERQASKKTSEKSPETSTKKPEKKASTHEPKKAKPAQADKTKLAAVGPKPASKTKEPKRTKVEPAKKAADRDQPKVAARSKPTPPKISLPGGRPEIAAAAVRPPLPGAAAVPSRSSGRKASSKSRGRRLGVRRFLELGVLSLVVGGFMLLAFHQFYVQPRTEALEAKLEDLTGVADSKSAVVPPSALAEPEPIDDQVELAASAELDSTLADPAQSAGGVRAIVGHPAAVDVRSTVTGWARAWSARRVDDYLGYYSDRFTPTSGVSREVWEQRRRQRLVGKKYIRVAVVAVEVQEPAVDERLVTFTQAYQSDTFRDRVRKTLRLGWEDGSWKILEESVLRQFPW